MSSYVQPETLKESVAAYSEAVVALARLGAHASRLDEKTAEDRSESARSQLLDHAERADHVVQAAEDLVKILSSPSASAIACLVVARSLAEALTKLQRRPMHEIERWWSR